MFQRYKYFVVDMTIHDEQWSVLVICVIMTFNKEKKIHQEYNYLNAIFSGTTFNIHQIMMDYKTKC